VSLFSHEMEGLALEGASEDGSHDRFCFFVLSGRISYESNVLLKIVVLSSISLHLLLDNCE